MSRVGHIAAAAAIALAVLAMLAGCPRESSTAVTKPDQVYTARGKVVTLPDPSKPASQLSIHHEPIPDFVGQNGQVIGMDSMEMPFTPAPGVSLKGLAPGDIVEFTFEVRWKTAPGSQLTRIRKLPPETVLNFGRAQEPGK